MVAHNAPVRSGELSEFDSDVHSLASVRTCAYSWIQKSKYAMPAEAAARWAATLGLALAIVVMYFGMQGILNVRPVSNWDGRQRVPSGPVLR